jgi:hypothetical protein
LRHRLVILSFLAVPALCLAVLSAANAPSASAQLCVTTPGIAVGATLVGTTVVPIYATSPVYCPATGPLPVGVSRTLSGLPGQYCSDASGGKVWIPTGAPTEGLTCPAAATASS